MKLSPARRVQSIDDLKKAGDYFGPTEETNNDGLIIGHGVWFLLPIHTGTGKNIFHRINRGDGLHRVSEPPWKFRECKDGSLEIRESILCGAHDPEGAYWHGYLDEGNVWREV